MDLKPHIEKFRKRFAELESLLSDSKVFDNPQSAQELSREYSPGSKNSSRPARRI
jgi:peptide chain release factor 1